MRSLRAALLDPFRSPGGVDRWLLLLFALVNGLVLLNAVLHDPLVGYDANDHRSYVRTLAELRLVERADSREFFSPPLPYAVPALALAAGAGRTAALKLAQVVNALLALGLTWYLLRACRLLDARPELRRGALLFLGLLTVHYKAFAFVRGEPYVAFFAMVVLWHALRIPVLGDLSARNAAALGAAMGLCALSRQWGILIFPAVYLLLAWQWVRLPSRRPALMRAAGLSLALVASVSGWFYLSLHARYGSIAAFNRKPAAGLSLASQPPEFYLGLSPRLLFTHPVRPAFRNRFPPIFYSEAWGDYYGYFTVYGRDRRSGRYVSGRRLQNIVEKRKRRLESNVATMAPYLGRVNLVALFPTALGLAALAAAAAGVLVWRGGPRLGAGRREAYGFLLLAVATSAAGYAWFLLRYPNPKGDTVKATYMLQVFPVVAILAGSLLAELRARSRRLHRLAVVALCLCWAHNLPAMVTRYHPFR